jgi:hypothetical protein
MKLFLTAFLQVLLVSVQTVFLSKSFMPGVGIVSFFISFVWTFNVSKVAFSNLKQKFIYSAGASLGAVCGLTLTDMFL